MEWGSPDRQLPQMIPDISVKPIIVHISPFSYQFTSDKKSNDCSIGREKVPGLT